LLLEVLVGIVGGGTTDKNNKVESRTETGALVVGGRGNGAGLGSFGLGVARLFFPERT
jgi:hypothetical protein